MAEYMDLYDQFRHQLTGQTILRGNQLKPDTYHLVAHVCLFNQEGQMLIQQRKADKKLWPGLYDFSAAGAVVKGETTNLAAQREVKEELNLDIDLTKVRPQLSMTFPFGFDDIYCVQSDFTLSDMTIDEAEVASIKFADKTEIIAMINAGTFINYKIGLIELLFDFINSHHDGMYQA